MFTIVICTKNSEKTIQKCLNSAYFSFLRLKGEKKEPGNIIIVDGKSTDKTIDIVKNRIEFYKETNVKLRILYDEGKGLAQARNIGLRATNTKHIMYLGSDNYLTNNNYSLNDIVIEMERNGWVGIALRTYLDKKETYIEKCLNLRYRLRFKSGKTKVIGTPQLWNTRLLKKYQFDDNMSYSDDTDICKRLNDGGYYVGYSNYFCYEIGDNKLKDVIARFKIYGKSDSQYWNKYKKEMTLKNKIQSLLHPYRAEYKDVIKKIPFMKRFKLRPFFILITIIRYIGWLKK